MAIEGTGLASGSTSVQPRPQSSQSSGTDNRAVQFTLDQSAAPAEPPAQPVVQPNSPADKYQQASALSFSSSGSRDVGGSDDRIELPASSPSSSQNSASAINYGSSGVANAPSSASQAGRLVSLSV